MNPHRPWPPAVQCPTCGAAAGSQCVAAGRLVPRGAPLLTHHAARQQAAPELRQVVARAIARLGNGVRGEEIAAATGVPEDAVFAALQRMGGEVVDRGDQGWFLRDADPHAAADALEKYAGEQESMRAFMAADRAMSAYAAATGAPLGGAWLANASGEELLATIRQLRGPMTNEVAGGERRAVGRRAAPRDYKVVSPRYEESWRRTWR